HVIQGGVVDRTAHGEELAGELPGALTDGGEDRLGVEGVVDGLADAYVAQGLDLLSGAVHELQPHRLGHHAGDVPAVLLGDRDVDRHGVGDVQLAGEHGVHAGSGVGDG